jgi:hypothetical protein
MAIILNANKVNLFVSSVLFVFWCPSPNVLEIPRMLFQEDVNLELGPFLKKGFTLKILGDVMRMMGHPVAQCLSHFATIRKVAGSIPDGVIGIFH